MAEKSKYFTPEFFAFFGDLAKNNNKEWFTKNKERYEKAVQEPSLQFIRDAGQRLQKISSFIVADAKPFGGSLSRIYRDIDSRRTRARTKRRSGSTSGTRRHPGRRRWRRATISTCPRGRRWPTPASGIPTRRY